MTGKVCLVPVPLNKYVLRASSHSSRHINNLITQPSTGRYSVYTGLPATGLLLFNGQKVKVKILMHKVDLKPFIVCSKNTGDSNISLIKFSDYNYMVVCRRCRTTSCFPSCCPPDIFTWTLTFDLERPTHRTIKLLAVLPVSNNLTRGGALENSAGFTLLTSGHMG